MLDTSPEAVAERARLWAKLRTHDHPKGGGTDIATELCRLYLPERHAGLYLHERARLAFSGFLLILAFKSQDGEAEKELFRLIPAFSESKEDFVSLLERPNVWAALIVALFWDSDIYTPTPQRLRTFEEFMEARKRRGKSAESGDGRSHNSESGRAVS